MTPTRNGLITHTDCEKTEFCNPKNVHRPYTKNVDQEKMKKRKKTSI